MNNRQSEIDNRKFKLSNDGWIHLIPKGEFRWTYPDGKNTIVQVIDDEALQAMKNNFRPEMLIDYEHESYDADKRTEAAGWITNVDVRPDGLWGKPRWSATGEEAVLGGSYRFISPTFLPGNMEEVGEGRLRPLRLDTCALTNKPNMRSIQPITNRMMIDTPIENYGTSEGARKGWETRGAVSRAVESKSHNQNPSVKKALTKYGKAGQKKAIARIVKSNLHSYRKAAATRKPSPPKPAPPRPQPPAKAARKRETKAGGFLGILKKVFPGSTSGVGPKVSGIDYSKAATKRLLREGRKDRKMIA